MIAASCYSLCLSMVTEPGDQPVIRKSISGTCRPLKVPVPLYVRRVDVIPHHQSLTKLNQRIHLRPRRPDWTFFSMPVVLAGEITHQANAYVGVIVSLTSVRSSAAYRTSRLHSPILEYHKVITDMILLAFVPRIEPAMRVHLVDSFRIDDATSNARRRRGVVDDYAGWPLLQPDENDILVFQQTQRGYRCDQQRQKPQWTPSSLSSPAHHNKPGSIDSEASWIVSNGRGNVNPGSYVLRFIGS
jgi:hypothetical protein